MKTLFCLAPAWLTKSPEEIVSFVWKVVEAYELKIEENLKGWDLWYKQQYLFAERNRSAVRAAQTHCVYCEQPLDDTSHVDHIEAIKNGGSGEITNLAYACAKCNLSKNGQDDHLPERACDTPRQIFGSVKDLCP